MESSTRLAAIASIALAACGGAPGSPPPATASVLAPLNEEPVSAPEGASAGAERLPARPLDDWERVCTAAARDADRAARAETTPHVATFGCVTLLVDNEMSSMFQLVQALVLVDDEIVFQRSDRDGTTDLSRLPSFAVLRARASDGDHEVKVKLVYKGVCQGIYSYCRGLKFEVKSTHRLTIVSPRAAELHVVGYEKGGVTTPLEERPALAYRYREIGPE